MLVNKPYHVPHAPRITTGGRTFMGILFGMSKECVRSWSHAFLVTNLKTFAKNSWQSFQKIMRRKRRRRKKRKTLTKFFALQANAKTEKK